MFGYALAFLSGVVFVQQLAVLPELSSLITLLLSSSLLWLVSRLANSDKNLAQKREYTLIKYYILLFIIGYMYAVLYANQRLSFRLDENYTGSNLLVSGDVSGVPVTDGHIQRFDFNIKSYRILTTNNNGINHGQTMRQFPQKLRLSWYYAEQVVYAGDLAI